MMRSTYNNNNTNNNSDEDDFAPNPFRSGIPNSGSMDFFETPMMMNTTSTTGTTTMNTINMMHDTQQPDPNTGMVGSVPQPHNYYAQPPSYYPQQPPPPPQTTTTTTTTSPYLTGTMDQMGGQHSKSPVPSGSSNNNHNNNNVFYSWLTTSCCIPYETLQSLFDIDTIDIYIRMKASLLNFHQPNYFRLQILGTKRNDSVTTTTPDDDHTDDTTSGIDPTNSHNNNKGPDLYGPIWISMTCMLLLGINANINDYYRHVQQQQQQHRNSHNNNNNNSNQTEHSNETVEDEFEYDLTHLLNAMYICFLYTFGISTFFWLVCICMGFNNGRHTNSSSNSSSNSNAKYLSWIYWVCHYGYSLVPILVGTCVAWILPYSLYHWLVLGIATFISSLFIVRNLSTPLLEQEMMVAPNDPTNGTFNNTTTTTTTTHAKAAPILLSILGVHFTFLLVLKLTFYP